MTTPLPVRLRDVTESDLPILFEQQRDPQVSYMAAFTSLDPQDREGFLAHWARVMANPDNIHKIILAGDQVAGSIVCFRMFDERNVGYELGPAFWGQGIATRALQAFLEQVRERPLVGRAAADNLGSIRVLEKCGFRLARRERSFAEARGQEIDEVVLVLE